MVYGNNGVIVYKTASTQSYYKYSVAHMSNVPTLFSVYCNTYLVCPTRVSNFIIETLEAYLTNLMLRLLGVCILWNCSSTAGEKLFGHHLEKMSDLYVRGGFQKLNPSSFSSLSNLHIFSWKFSIEFQKLCKLYKNFQKCCFSCFKGIISINQFFREFSNFDKFELCSVTISSEHKLEKFFR